MGLETEDFWIIHGPSSNSDKSNPEATNLSAGKPQTLTSLKYLNPKAQKLLIPTDFSLLGTLREHGAEGWWLCGFFMCSETQANLLRMLRYGLLPILCNPDLHLKP